MSMESDFRYTVHIIVRIFRFFFRLLGKILSFLIGILTFGFTKARIKRNNKENRGLLIAKEQQDVKMIGMNYTDRNMIISGGDAATRADLISNTLAASSVFTNQNGMIILHINDYELVNFIESSGFSNIVRIDDINQIYDPFYHRTNDEIINLISDSYPNGNLSSGAVNLLYGVLEYIRLTGGTPYLEALKNCPYSRLVDIVNQKIDIGRIKEADGDRILQYITAGNSEIPVISNYISLLHKECNACLCKSHLSNSVDIKSAIDNGQIVVMNVFTAANGILLNILFSQIKDILRYSPHTTIVLDNLNISSSAKKVKEIVEICNNNLIFLADDLYASLSSDDRLFNILVSRSKCNMILRHSDATGSNKWSEKIGSYEKEQTSVSFGDVFSGHKFGLGRHIDVRKVNERIVKPEEIQQLLPNQMYVRDCDSNTITLTTF